MIVLTTGRAAAIEVVWTSEAEQAGWEHLIDVGRLSSDLRVRIVHSIGGLQRRGNGFVSIETLPIETLVDQARGSSDAVVLSLMVDRCLVELRKEDRCDAIDFARRWTIVDTQNQLSWIALSTTLFHAGDVEGARAAFRRAAQASQWREYSPEVARLLDASVEKSSDVRLRSSMLVAILAKAAASSPNQHYETISIRCLDADLRDACGRLLDVMGRDAQSLPTLDVAAGQAIARGALPAATASALRQRADAMHWAATISRSDESADLARQARHVKYLEDVLAYGGLEALRRSLQDARVSEAEAATRYRAALAADVRASRATSAGKAPGSN